MPPVENMNSSDAAAAVVDRLWRAYAPYQRGRSTDRDLTAMLAVLLLGAFIDSVEDPGSQLVTRWSRATAEARIGYPPLRDLRAALSLAADDARFPAHGRGDLQNALVESKDAADDLPWTASFLTALYQPPTASEAGFTEVAAMLLERYVAESPALTGEYYTPREVTRLLADSLAPRPGDRVLDPACGTGGFLLAAAQHISEQGYTGELSFEGYAMDHRNTQVATLNLAVHGFDQPQVRSAEPGTLFRDPGNGMADVLLSNPPFNQRVQGLEHMRWPFGAPPETNANFAWLQLAWSRLSAKGMAAVIMPTGAASVGGPAAGIRRAMLDAGALLGIVALPPNLFSHTEVPVHIWFLAREKTLHVPREEADSLLFIDASRLGTRAGRRQKLVLGEAERERITSRFRAWLRSPTTTPDEPGFSCSVPYEAIPRNEGCLLDPRLYVTPTQDRPSAAVDTRRLLDALVAEAEATADETARLRNTFDQSERVTRSGTEVPRVRLREIVDGTATPEVAEPAPGLLLAGPSGSLIRAEQYVESEGVPVVMPKNLASDGFNTSDIRRISEQQADSLERFRIRCGDVVLARRGELGRAAVARPEQHGWVCGTGCFVMRPPAGLDADYFAAYLRSPEARTWLEARSTGSMKMKTIPLAVFAELPVALPDLVTQRAIADAMTRLDEHERRLRQQLDLALRIRRSTLDGGILSAP